MELEETGLRVQPLVIGYQVSEFSDASMISLLAGRVLLLISAEAEMAVETIADIVTPMSSYPSNRGVET
ncbi:hypothetical protein N7501_003807 [Penicillium viridicatum]|nr:hypothetical protein N7501_003807 [Penicillium viridicatum]